MVRVDVVQAVEIAVDAVVEQFSSASKVEEHEGYLRFELDCKDCQPLAKAMLKLQTIANMTSVLQTELREASLQDIFLKVVTGINA